MRVTLPSKQADGNPNWVDLREADDLLAEDLFAIHRAVRIIQDGSGKTTYSVREMEDDQVNALLARVITAWSFPSPVPAAQNFAAADVVIGRAMKARDWAALRKAVRPLMDELEGAEREDPKEPPPS
jgi:hypothetical protein